jgi:2-polyprenyl-3-methyl-5-hydroxy-6-metoxy-1,4-benzoquinol methylase
MGDNFWDTRYSESVYAYGTEPNEFFKEELNKLAAGKLLLPGEGEGRNAVYAAKNGWEVTAVDLSAEGKKKALKLADENKVDIKYTVSPLDEYAYAKNEYDVTALIFVHFHQDTREKTHKAIIGSLKKGGVLLIEAFSKSQINNDSGGPKDVSSLYSIEDLRQDFSELKIDSLSEHQVQLSEGPYHKGTADVIRLKAIK